jgi:hypothetical protein
MGAPLVQYRQSAVGGRQSGLLMLARHLHGRAGALSFLAETKEGRDAVAAPNF